MSVIPWVGFLVLVFFLLALDLGVLNRKVHAISTKEALKWTVFWISLAIAFSGVIYCGYNWHWFGLGLHEGATESGVQAWMDYMTGYLIEKALSLDNIAVMSMIFASFGVPLKYQHRVLFWGILGALIFRGVMIGLGAALVSSWSWVLWIFGAVLLVLAIKTTFGEEDETDPQDKLISKFLTKHFPYYNKIEGMHFFRKIDGKTLMTPLIVTLVVIEVSDVIFAVDSIPAIFGITTDPFIVFTSNIFAILGLRSLYFVLASILEKFCLLKYSVGAILLFVAVKLLIPAGYWLVNLTMGTDYEAFELPNWSSLAFVVIAITVGIVASLLYVKKHPEIEEQAAKEREEKAKREAELEAAVEQNEKKADSDVSTDKKSAESEDKPAESEDKPAESEDKPA
ncbi:MAG: TerC/Alx family metal homeostasis membrane protein, partial [Proteobacteria bacterium]|nr:TerC/Alx family metal homeostasis membrane protein [Pseudomonadota bacterium]